MDNTNNIFSFFDDIVCINLKTRIDRRKWSEHIFSSLNIPYRFYLTDKSPKGGRYGCFESHINVIREAYNKGHSNILIFEDDLLPTPEYSLQNIEACINFMKNNKWDLFYFGYFVMNKHLDNIIIAKKLNNNIIKYNPLATHAYVVNRNAMKTILETYYKYISYLQVDEFLTQKELNFNSYCCVPMMFEQKLCFETDNKANNMIEFFFRQFSCVIEKENLLYNISCIVYEREYYIIVFLCSFMIVFIILMSLYNLFNL
jgi:GR25 family glycosyltransferase involved in LPS biosynthesis